MIFRSTLAIGRLPVVSRVSYMFPGSRGGVARGPGAGFPGKRARSGGEDFPRSADARATSSRPQPLLDLACPLHRLTLAWLRPCISAKRLIETTGLAESG